MAVNDRLDRRITSPVRASEYIYREVDRQLRRGQEHWKKDAEPSTGRP